MTRYIYISSLLLIFFASSVAAQSSSASLKGRVIDASGRAIEFATVSITELNRSVFTDANGQFHLRFNEGTLTGLTLQVTYVGKQTFVKKLSATDYDKSLEIALQELSLTLDHVTVSAEQTADHSSNSSIVFNRQAIEQVQAYSLMDVLNNLPGRSTTAPDLQHLQNITLRNASSSDPTQQAVNSMGVGIFIDGIRQSNDANMQNTNIGIRGVRGALVTRRYDPGVGSVSYDTPFSGLDIRNIPADNIERIEVVSGVASAKYGELTDGAIIIDRKAGRTPYQVNLRLNGSSTNVSMSKGYSLGNKAGALNVNLNYLNSIQNPTDNIKNYSRVSGGTMWSTTPLAGVKNTFSTDFSYKNDHARIDPDDAQQTRMYSKERQLRLANRTSVEINSKWVQQARFNLSYDFGYNETYSQFLINKAPIAVADKDTTGVYEGYFSNGNFLATDQIIGKPYNASGSLDLTSSFITGETSHEIAYGANAYLSGNTGRGVIADPTLPQQNLGNDSYKSERPYDFDLTRPLFNFGFYLEDRVKLKFLNRDMSITGGIRYDLQNGYPSIQPRINTSYRLSERWTLRGAYGIATKSPSMAYRYPGPTYFDIPLLNVYRENAQDRIFLVYTRKVVPDNSDLKPSRSRQFELGASADYGFIKASIFGYMKKNRDGYNSVANVQPVAVPVYVFKPGETPRYEATDELKYYINLNVSEVGNNVQSDNWGIELFANTRMIPAIQTSFSFNTSLSYTRYNNTGNTIQQAADSYIPNSTAWYGIYPGTNSRNLNIMSKLNADVHLPKIGFVLSMLLDVYWRNHSQYLGNSIEPVAYIDRYGNTVPIVNFDRDNKDYGYLLLVPDRASNLTDPPFVYGTLSVRLAKEIRKKIRVSLFAYNFLDIKTQYYNPVTTSFTTYGSPINVGAEVSFKF